jgi:phenylacetate-CoA ligase
VLDSNPFYRQRFGEAGLTHPADLRTIDDLSCLPFTTKQDFLDDQIQSPPYGTNLTYPVARYTRVHQTSGTTGEPLRWLDTQESWSWMALCWEAVFNAAGVSSADRIYFAFSFGPFIGFWAAHEAANNMGALAIPGGDMSSLQRLHAILASDATVLLSTPTYALRLAEVADAEGIDLRNSGIRVTIHGGEPGAGIPATRKRIEEAWGATCYDHAGSTEVGPWGFEGPEQLGLYVNEAEYIFEIIDPVTAEPSNEGELVITNLGRIGMPAYRYRTRDRVRLDVDPPDTGIPFRLLKDGVIGRIDDAVTIRGVTVYPSMFENIIRGFSEIEEFSVDVRSGETMDEIELCVEVTSGDPSSIADAVEKAVRNAIGMRVPVSPVDPESLPRFEVKAKRFHDHRA